MRIQKSSLERLIPDLDVAMIGSILQSAHLRSSLNWPITFKYRLLINQFIEEVVEHPFRELFAIKNISILIEYTFSSSIPSWISSARKAIT